MLFSKTRLGLVSSIIALLCIPACSSNKNDASARKGAGGARPNSITADVFIVSEQPFSESLNLAGRLLPNEETDITAEVSGKITNLYFHEGSAVAQGQTLVRLYDADVRAGLQKLRAQRALQVTLRQRQGELVNIGGISRQEYDATTTSIAALDADIAATEAQLSRLVIRAPFSGRIGLRNVSVGAVVSPGMLIARLQQNNPLKLDIEVPDQYSEAIFVGKEIPFTVAGMQDSFSAKVYAVEPGAGGGTATIRARARVQNPNNRLTAGSIATANLALGNGNRHAIVVPSQSVVPTTRDRRVMRVENGKVNPVTVQTGTRTAAGIQIISGLEVGDTILTTGLMQARPGMDVKVRQVKQ